MCPKIASAKIYICKKSLKLKKIKRSIIYCYYRLNAVVKMFSFTEPNFVTQI
jgi:hypothetical protein